MNRDERKSQFEFKFMQKILEEKFNKKVQENFDYNFVAETGGLYVVEISARAQGVKQIGANKTDDEDLRIEIDGRRFPKLDNLQRYLDSPAAFSGGLLHNFEKTVYFLANFSAGSHQLAFIPDQNPLLEKLLIYFVGESVNKINLDVNKQAEDGDRRPWLTFILIDLPLQSLTAKVTARWRWQDSDDVKLIIDNQIPKNPLSVWHKNWLWCANVFKKLFQIETQTKTIEANLSSGLHYLEFWADRMPTLHNLELDFGENIEISPALPKFYTYRGVKNNEDYNRFDQKIIQTVTYWNNFFSKQDNPPPKLLDPNLVKAIIYIESRMGYEEGGYPDVMQVGNINDPALHTLNNDGWIDPRTKEVALEYEWQDGEVKVLDYQGEANTQTPEESIKWGIRWLYHKAQEIKDGKRFWRSWQEATQRYGPGTKEYQDKVWRVYQKGLTPQGIKLWSILLFLLIPVITLGLWLSINQGHVYFSFKNLGNFNDYQIVVKIIDGFWPKRVELTNVYANGGNFLAIDKQKPIYVEYLDIDNDRQKEIIITGSYFGVGIKKYVLKKVGLKFKKVDNIGEFGEINPAFSSERIFFEDINRDGKCEAVEKFRIFYSNAPHEIQTTYYQLNSDGQYKFLKKEKEVGDSFFGYITERMEDLSCRTTEIFIYNFDCRDGKFCPTVNRYLTLGI